MDFRVRLRKLHALLGSSNKNERDTAWAKVDEILRQHRKNWNDLPELLQIESAAANSSDDNEMATPADVGANISALDLVHELLKQYLALNPHEYTAVALWILHTHVFSQFVITPRLALVSPVRGCGKTTACEFLVLLTARGRKEDGITPAAIIRLIDQERCTMMLDEGDNLGLDFRTNGILRSILNSGHRRGGSLTKVIKDAPKRFVTFAPLAIAAIGMLPLPLMHRAIVVHMERATRTLRRLDGSDPAINVAYDMVRTWAGSAKLNLEPELPKELRNRPADNWRPLVSIADSFGAAWGASARDAAIYFSRTHRDEDAAVILLNDIHVIFDQRGVDRLASAVLVAELVAMDDSMWSDWRGRRDDQQPRCLSQGELASLLKPFGIGPKSVWPRQRRQGAKSSKGYKRAWFEAAWAAYCDAGTPAQASETGRLHRN
jgi:hypothetical protein